jgi:hypothetical protein
MKEGHVFLGRGASFLDDREAYKFEEEADPKRGVRATGINARMTGG